MSGANWEVAFADSAAATFSSETLRNRSLQGKFNLVVQFGRWIGGRWKLSKWLYGRNLHEHNSQMSWTNRNGSNEIRPNHSNIERKVRRESRLVFGCDCSGWLFGWEENCKWIMFRIFVNLGTQPDFTIYIKFSVKFVYLLTSIKFHPAKNEKNRIILFKNYNWTVMVRPPAWTSNGDNRPLNLFQKINFLQLAINTLYLPIKSVFQSHYGTEQWVHTATQVAQNNSLYSK